MLLCDGVQTGFSPLATAAELKAALDQGQPLTVLDVRSPAEFEKGHVKGATNIPLDRLRTGWKASSRFRKALATA